MMQYGYGVPAGYPAAGYPASGYPAAAVPTTYGYPAMATYNPADDARRLKEAMRGLGTNDSVLIDIIGHRDRVQRLMIVEEYRRSMGGDLLKDLESETSGNYRKVLLKLMMPREQMLAELIHEALAGAGTNDGVVMDIMTQFPYELPAVAAAYKAKYKKSLESDIKGDTTGNYEDILVALLNTPRPPPGVVDPTRAATDADAFYRAGEGRLGTNERTYINIIVSNSREQLLLMDENYRRLHSKGMEHAIKSETSGHFRDTLLACITPFDKYFATRVKDAVEGAGTNDLSLVTIFCANERPQLQMIAAAYQKLYGKTMAKRVAEDVSGDYKRILMALL